MSTSETITRTDLANILNEVLPNLSSTSLQYVGTVNQIHWSSWTATDDGFVLMDISWLTGGGGGYYYIKDTTDNRYIAKMTTSNANGTSQTRLFPVIKGHTYQKANVEKVDGNYITFHFYKLKATQVGGAQTKTLTGTTDANGNLSLGLSTSAASSIVSVVGSNYVSTPFVYSGNWYAKVVSSNSSSTPIVSESVSVTIKYI